MNIRLPFAGAFFILLLLAGYAGLSSLQLGGIINDKVLHVVTFFVLTVVFYWIVDTSRRRTLNMTLVVCTGGLSIGSELLQAVIPNNNRLFDLFDIVANIGGSLAGIALCSWYHKRMIERKRHRKYAAVPGDEVDEDLLEGEDTAAHGSDGAANDPDVELGNMPPQPLGSTVLHDTPEAMAASAGGASSTAAAVSTGPARPTTAPRTMSLEEELDNWDENAEDPWVEDDDAGDLGGSTDTKKRKD